MRCTAVWRKYVSVLCNKNIKHWKQLEVKWCALETVTHSGIVNDIYHVLRKILGNAYHQTALYTYCIFTPRLITRYKFKNLTSHVCRAIDTIFSI